MKQKTIIIILIGIIFILGSTLGYLLFFQGENRSGELVLKQKETEINKYSDSPDSSKNFQSGENESLAEDIENRNTERIEKDKFYGNPKYNFSFNYPFNWEVTNKKDGIYLRSPENQKCIREAEKSKQANHSAGDAFFFCSDMEIAVVKENPAEDIINEKIGKMKIGGKEAQTFHMGGYGSYYGAVVEHEDIFFRFDFKGCHRDECIKNGAISEELKQVLDSFKFK